MEENQNSGVDMSNYWESAPKKKNVPGKVSKEENKKKKNRIYVIIIVICLLMMAALWAYYYLESQIAY